jgi:hypothetical protein
MSDEKRAEKSPIELAPEIMKTLRGVEARTAMAACEIAKIMVPYRPPEEEKATATSA